MLATQEGSPAVDNVAKKRFMPSSMLMSAHYQIPHLLPTKEYACLGDISRESWAGTRQGQPIAQQLHSLLHNSLHNLVDVPLLCTPRSSDFIYVATASRAHVVAVGRQKQSKAWVQTAPLMGWRGSAVRPQSLPCRPCRRCICQEHQRLQQQPRAARLDDLFAVCQGSAAAAWSPFWAVVRF